MDGRDELRTREMLLWMVRSLVDRPDDVEIALVSDPEGSVFQIQAHITDFTMLIGGNGETARALQTIVGASGTKAGRRFNVDVVRWTRDPLAGVN